MLQFLHLAEEQHITARHCAVQGAVLSALVLVWQWWELDSDHDFLVSKNDLLRYGNHSLTYRIVERIFTQVRSACVCGCEGRGLRHMGCLYICVLRSLSNAEYCLVQCPSC